MYPKTQDALSSFQWIHRNPLFGGSMDALLGLSLSQGAERGSMIQGSHSFKTKRLKEAIIYKLQTIMNIYIIIIYIYIRIRIYIYICRM